MSLNPIRIGLHGLVLPLLLACAFASPVDDSIELVGRNFRPGEIFLVVVKTQIPAEQLEGEFVDRPLYFFKGKKDTVLAFGAVDLKDPIGKLTISIKAKNGNSLDLKKEIEVIERKFRIQKLKVDDKYVKFSKEDEMRIENETVEQKEVFAKVTPERFFDGNFILPIHAKSSGRFGERRFFNEEERNPHGGEDLKAKSGTPVKASARGKVALAKELFFSGNMIVLDHGYGLYSYYAHLSKMDVNVGDLVEQGQVIGKVGATGRVTGPHLHWGVKLNDARVDPFSLYALGLKKYL